MRVSQDAKVFQPVMIVLETEEEVMMLAKVLCNLVTFGETDQMFTLFDKLSDIAPGYEDSYTLSPSGSAATHLRLEES